MTRLWGGTTVLSYPVLPSNFITLIIRLLHTTCTHTYMQSGFRYWVLYQTQTAHICFQRDLTYSSLAISQLHTCYLAWDLFSMPSSQYIWSTRLNSWSWGVFIWDLWTSFFSLTICFQFFSYLLLFLWQMIRYIHISVYVYTCAHRFCMKFNRLLSHVCSSSWPKA